MVRFVAALLALGAMSASPPPDVEAPPDVDVPTPNEAFASFSVRVNGLDVCLRRLALGVAPGARVTIGQEGAARRLRVSASTGRLRRTSGRWTWTAPTEPGFHDVVVSLQSAQDTIRLTLMVLRPATEIVDGQLNGYRIGRYLPRNANRSRVYDPPTGFIEADPSLYDRFVSPNFRLRDFLCKDPGDPRYLLVSPRLLEKLEALLIAVNEAGYPADRLTVMSGFRTPAYNRAIGNTTDLSRHLWGDAADVYVDTDGNGEMDDVNRDGVVDVRDARWLATLMEQAMAADPTLVRGGLSVYRRNAVRGPFLHVDARGVRARW